MRVNYIRKLADGTVTEKGSCPEESWEALKKMAPKEYKLDDGNTQLSPIKPSVLPAPVVDPNMVTVEELTDAVLKFADGDRSALSAIALRRKRQIRKAESGADTGSAAKRSAGRTKAASK